MAGFIHTPFNFMPSQLGGKGAQRPPNFSDPGWGFVITRAVTKRHKGVKLWALHVRKNRRTYLAAFHEGRGELWVFEGSRQKVPSWVPAEKTLNGWFSGGRKNPKTKWNSDLIDSQVMMLAQGGDIESMFEVQRRVNTKVPGSRLYQGKKNPKTDWVEQRYNGTWFIQRWYGGEFGKFSSEAKAKAHLREEQRAQRKGKKNPSPPRQYGVESVIGEDGADWAKWAQDRQGIPRRNPRVFDFVASGRGGKVSDLVGTGSLGSGPRGGYTKRERTHLSVYAPQMFLASEKSPPKWPVADRAHVNIALTYMTAGRGADTYDYAMLIHRLAKLWPVSEDNQGIWDRYKKLRGQIQDKCGCRMPTVQQLSTVRANPVLATAAVMAVAPMVINLLSKQLQAHWGRLLQMPVMERAQALEGIVSTAMLTTPPFRIIWRRLMPAKMKKGLLISLARGMETSTAQDLAAQVGQAALDAAQSKVAKKAANNRGRGRRRR